MNVSINLVDNTAGHYDISRFIVIRLNVFDMISLVTLKTKTFFTCKARTHGSLDTSRYKKIALFGRTKSSS